VVTVAFTVMIALFCASPALLADTAADAVKPTAKKQAPDQPKANTPDKTSKADSSDSAEFDHDDLPPGPRQRHDGKGTRGPNTAGNKVAELQPRDMPDALEVLHDFNPVLAQRLEDWLKEHPQNARQLLSRRVPWIVRLVKLRREDPAGYQLSIADLRYYARTNDLANELRQAQAAADKDQAKIDDLTGHLQKLLAEHFDLRQKMRERDIQKLQDRLTQLRKQMDQRLSSRDHILQGRFKQLTSPRQEKTGKSEKNSDKKNSDTKPDAAGAA
jgi:hypothetical protein